MCDPGVPRLQVDYRRALCVISYLHDADGLSGQVEARVQQECQQEDEGPVPGTHVADGA